MTPWLVQVPQLREAPEDIRRALRQLDPTAEVLYLGWGAWSVGRVRPTDQSVRIGQRMLRNYWAMGAQARASKRGVQRYRFADAAVQGFRPVQEYTQRELDDRVVKDFQQSQWRMQHQRGDLLDEWERAEEQERQDRRAMLGDVDAAKDVVNYVRQTNFGYAVSSVAKPTPQRAGRTLIRTV